MKSAVILLSFLAFSTTYGQLSTNRDQDCKENETFNTCGSACEPSCAIPNPSFCTLQCVVGCQCDKGFYRDAENKCVKNCNPGTSSVPPIAVSVPAPNMTCGANEEFSNCHNPCTEKKCPVADPVMVNCLMACMDGCACKSGFVRNEKGVCVKEDACPPVAAVEPNPCNLVDCKSGLTCQIVSGAPKCVQPAADISNGTTMSSNGNSTFVTEPSLPGGTTCATVRCTADRECVEFEKACLKAPCSTSPRCVPKSNTTLSDPSDGCAAVTCPVGEKCEETALQCFAAPCPKAVTCVPIDSTKNSTARGGCDVVRCNTDETCEEQTVNCLKAPCPVQVACVKVTHHLSNSTVIPPPVANNSTGGCGTNQTMSDCLNTCSESKCPGTESSMLCTKHCSKGCACQSGFLRSSDGQCYKKADCPADQVCGQNEEYRCATCGTATCKNPEPDCERNKKCKKACVCAVGFVKKNGKCVSMDKCPDHDHGNITCRGTEEFTDCLPQCTQLCSGVQQCTTEMSTMQCKAGCVCRRNYKMDSDGACVHNRHCFKTTTCADTEEWTKCLGVEATCEGDAHTTRHPQRDQCFSGCTCSSGFVRSNNGTCIEKAHC